MESCHTSIPGQVYHDAGQLWKNIQLDEISSFFDLKYSVMDSVVLFYFWQFVTRCKIYEPYHSLQISSQKLVEFPTTFHCYRLEIIMCKECFSTKIVEVFFFWRISGGRPLYHSKISYLFLSLSQKNVKEPTF